VQASLPATGWWTGSSVDTLTGGPEFELAKDLCAQLGIGRVRVVNQPRAAIEAGQTTDFDVALAEIPATATKNVDVSTGYFTTAQGAQFVAVLPKGSANTTLVNAAIAKLKANGTLTSVFKDAPKSG
jgi:ABC-type amino acid transport substrate-binding protein